MVVSYGQMHVGDSVPAFNGIRPSTGCTAQRPNATARLRSQAKEEQNTGNTFSIEWENMVAVAEREIHRVAVAGVSHRLSLSPLSSAFPLWTDTELTHV